MSQSCLIAANDPWFIQLITMYSEECGLCVLQAFDANEILQKTCCDHPAAIILQFDLLGINQSHELIKKLRAHPAAKDVAVIVFSWQEKDANLGDDGVIAMTEPVSYTGFLEALEQAGLKLQGRRTNRNEPGSVAVKARTKR
jgi:hypothetical protein